jgi:hypothetical protein
MGVGHSHQVSYFEIYQEKIRDLLAVEKAVVELTAKPARPHTPSSMMSNTVSGSFGQEVGDGVDDDRSSHCGSLVEDGAPSVATSNLEATSADGDTGSCFTVIDELGNVTDAHIPRLRRDGTIKAHKSKRKMISLVAARDPTLQKPNNHFSSLWFGDLKSIKKETFLKVREHPVSGPYVEGLLWKDVREWADMERLIKHGAANRTTSATDMNEHSSRSHALFTIKITRVCLHFLLYIVASLISCHTIFLLRYKATQLKMQTDLCREMWGVNGRVMARNPALSILLTLQVTCPNHVIFTIPGLVCKFFVYLPFFTLKRLCIFA